jgi:hypothetical protein
VLSYLESHGPIRTRDVGLALGVGKATINALMQYPKRKNAARLVSDAHFAPYELTAEGREILAAMRRRAAGYLSDLGPGTLIDRKAA